MDAGPVAPRVGPALVEAVVAASVRSRAEGAAGRRATVGRGPRPARRARSGAAGRAPAAGGPASHSASIARTAVGAARRPARGGRPGRGPRPSLAGRGGGAGLERPGPRRGGLGAVRGPWVTAGADRRHGQPGGPAAPRRAAADGGGTGRATDVDDGAHGAASGRSRPRSHHGGVTPGPVCLSGRCRGTGQWRRARRCRPSLGGATRRLGRRRRPGPPWSTSCSRAPGLRPARGRRRC